MDTSVHHHETQPCSRLPSTAGEAEALEPNPGEEGLFVVEHNPFAFSPGQLSKLIEPKSLPALRALGGMEGLERGLRTNSRSGLSVDETRLTGVVTFQEATRHTGSKSIEEPRHISTRTNSGTPSHH